MDRLCRNIWGSGKGLRHVSKHRGLTRRGDQDMVLELSLRAKEHTGNIRIAYEGSNKTAGKITRI